MYDLNSQEPQSISLGLDRPAIQDVRAEFGARLEAITPSVLITPVLVGFNVLLFLVMLLNGVPLFEPTTGSLLQWGANYGPSTITDGQWWRLGSSMFLHIGIIHLAFNMFVL